MDLPTAMFVHPGYLYHTPVSQVVTDLISAGISMILTVFIFAFILTSVDIVIKFRKGMKEDNNG